MLSNIPIHELISKDTPATTYIILPTARIFLVKPPTAFEGFLNPPTISGSIPDVCAIAGLVDKVPEAKIPNPVVIRDDLKNSLLDLTLSSKGCWNALVLRGPINNISI
jgi:hypothetical protein